MHNNGEVPINCTKTHGKVASLDDQAVNASLARYPHHLLSAVHTQGGIIVCQTQCRWHSLGPQMRRLYLQLT